MNFLEYKEFLLFTFKNFFFLFKNDAIAKIFNCLNDE